MHALRALVACGRVCGVGRSLIQLPLIDRSSLSDPLAAGFALSVACVGPRQLGALLVRGPLLNPGRLAVEAEQSGGQAPAPLERRTLARLLCCAPALSVCPWAGPCGSAFVYLLPEIHSPKALVEPSSARKRVRPFMKTNGRSSEHTSQSLVRPGALTPACKAEPQQSLRCRWLGRQLPCSI